VFEGRPIGAADADASFVLDAASKPLQASLAYSVGSDLEGGIVSAGSMG
jgi:hypothetical protein